MKTTKPESLALVNETMKTTKPESLALVDESTRGPARARRAFAAIAAAGALLPAACAPAAAPARGPPRSGARASCAVVDAGGRLAGPAAIESVEAHYAYVPAKRGLERRLTEATLRVRLSFGLNEPLP
jgi:hypothetical protein